MEIDREDQLVFLSGSRHRWSMNTLEGSESGFPWSVLEAAIEWLESRPEPVDFRAFQDKGLPEELEESVCALVLGVLPDAAYFGYRGFESFWGGVTDQEDVLRLLREVSKLRPIPPPS